jgi:hypothetical protein
MSTQEERLQILTMLAEGKIKADEAARLIEALDKMPPAQKASAPVEGVPPAGGTGKSTRWLRVRVTDTDSGKVRVNVRLPVGLIKAGTRFGARFAPEIEGMDIDQLISYIDSGEMGQIVDVQDEEDGEHVEVFIE